MKRGRAEYGSWLHKSPTLKPNTIPNYPPPCAPSSIAASTTCASRPCRFPKSGPASYWSRSPPAASAAPISKRSTPARTPPRASSATRWLASLQHRRRRHWLLRRRPRHGLSPRSVRRVLLLPQGNASAVPALQEDRRHGRLRALRRRLCRVHPRDGLRGPQPRRGPHP